ncbi:Multidrug efflux system ATP-binding protein [subsurface metagenome]|jgi:ABC-2 type transport system ATP-binding protein
MRAILNYLHIQTGEITVLGFDHKKDYIEIRKKIGYIPGELALYDNFTGAELIKYFNKFRPHKEEFLKELKDTFTVDLTQKIRTLSSGNKKQVGIILALASKPAFLLLDEPTSGLDPLITSRFHRIIKQLKSEGITIFLSSHNLSEVQAVCDRVAIIKDGKIILVEKIEDLKNKFLQNIKIVFSSNNSPNEKDFKSVQSIVSFEKSNNNAYRLKIKENIDELLSWLTGYDVERITIEDASLEEIFLHYYE